MPVKAKNQTQSGNLARTPQTETQITLTTMIEITRGCRNKYEYCKEKNAIIYDRMLYSSVQYPSDYGFILDTLAQDGDPLDALVLIWEPTFPGCLVDVKPVGMLNMSDDKGVDQKILCVPINDPLWNHINHLDQVPPHLLKEIHHFFSTYKALENKTTKIEGWHNREEALKIIKQAQDAFTSAARHEKNQAHQ
jgi:inorganic pyrophosphatase